MKSTKFVAFFAAFGFIVSLIFGFFSHSNFLSILLKALIFGIVFGVLGFCVSLVFSKFLFTEGFGEEDDDISSANPKFSFSGNNDSKGHVVDITIKDEDLPPSASDNHFLVGDNHQLLNETDYGKVNANVQEIKNVQNNEPEPNSSFKPVKNLETLTNVSSKESIKPDEIASAAPVSKNEKVTLESKSSSENEIDTLPDISGFAIENNPQTNSESIVEEADYDSGDEFVTTATRSTSSNAEVPEIKDASLIAKAISSVLSAEDS